jgi:hypothetical protein
MVLRYEQKREDVAAASRLMTYKTRYFLIGLWLFVLVTNIPDIRRSIAHGGTLRDALNQDAGLFLTLVLLGAFFLFLAWLLPRAMAWRTILRTVDWKLADEGVEIQSEVSSTRIRWEAFIKSREDRKVFLLYVQKNSAQFIPKRVLSAEQLSELRDIVSRHVKKV